MHPTGAPDPAAHARVSMQRCRLAPFADRLSTGAIRPRCATASVHCALTTPSSQVPSYAGRWLVCATWQKRAQAHLWNALRTRSYQAPPFAGWLTWQAMDQRATLLKHAPVNLLAARVTCFRKRIQFADQAKVFVTTVQGAVESAQCVQPPHSRPARPCAALPLSVMTERRATRQSTALELPLNARATRILRTARGAPVELRLVVSTPSVLVGAHAPR